MTAASDTILYDLRDGIATITFNRPDNLNTMPIEMMMLLLRVIEQVDADDAVRAVIVTGAGRAFCAGADLSSGGNTFDYAKREGVAEREQVDGIFRDWGGIISLRLFQSVKPWIAAVNGAAAGMGATLQAAMDVRLASTTSKYVFPFVRRGIVPEAAGTWFLTRIVRLPVALEWCLTGRQVSAQEALERGMVRSLHEPEDLMPAARALAAEIVEQAAPVSIALTRQMFWRMAGAEHPMEAHRADSRAVMQRGPTDDVKEGIQSFLDRRAPNFTGNVSADMPNVFPEWVEPKF